MSSSRLLTADQIAERLSFPKSWVYEAARRGDLPVVQLGRYKRFRAEAIDAWIKAQEKSAA
jgi:excisionase family DNA binding protein